MHLSQVGQVCRPSRPRLEFAPPLIVSVVGDEETRSLGSERAAHRVIGEGEPVLMRREGPMLPEVDPEFFLGVRERRESPSQRGWDVKYPSVTMPECC